MFTRKILTLLLALALACGLTVTAYAGSVDSAKADLAVLPDAASLTLEDSQLSLAAALGGGTAEFTSPRTSDGSVLTPAEVRNFRKELAAVRKKLI